MDEMLFLADFPSESHELLDVDALTDADFTVAELTAAGDLAQPSTAVWEGAASAVGHVAAGSRVFLEATKDLIGVSDLDSALRGGNGRRTRPSEPVPRRELIFLHSLGERGCLALPVRSSPTASSRLAGLAQAGPTRTRSVARQRSAGLAARRVISHLVRHLC